MRGRYLFIPILVLALSACQTRSISNSDTPGYGTNPSYRGELSEIDVLAPDMSQPVTEERIRAALAGSVSLHAEIGRPLLVIQSGAPAPDQEMVQALEPVFKVVPFSGVPAGANAGLGPDFAKRLRLIAAEGGYRHILCYWGELESAREAEAGKIVSWVPVVGWMVPDETQAMRIRLKAAIIDVETGRWRMILPDPAEDERGSAMLNRRTADQDQVKRLKSLGYARLARDLIQDASIPPSAALLP